MLLFFELHHAQLFLIYHHSNPKRSGNPNYIKKVKDWDTEFVNNIDKHMLIPLINVAPFLQIQPLTDLMIKTVADTLKDMSVTEIREKIKFRMILHLRKTNAFDPSIHGLSIILNFALLPDLLNTHVFQGVSHNLHYQTKTKLNLQKGSSTYQWNKRMLINIIYELYIQILYLCNIIRDTAIKVCDTPFAVVDNLF